MEKIKISQDVLQKYLEGHHFKTSMLARKMGVSGGIVSGCFNHKLNRHGKPLKFSEANIVKLNAALEQVARELIGCKLEFNDDVKPNQRGTKYDPELVIGIQRIGEYIKLKGMLDAVLGWNDKKSEGVVSVKNSPTYGNVTKDDAERINTEILAVAATLSGWEVVADKE